MTIQTVGGCEWLGGVGGWLTGLRTLEDVRLLCIWRVTVELPLSPLTRLQSIDDIQLNQVC